MIPADPWSTAIIAGANAIGQVAAADAAAPVSSGGSQFDGRSFFDGSGWTVSTGSSSARGGDRSGGVDQGGASMPRAVPPSTPILTAGGAEPAAGFSPGLGLGLIAMAAAAALL